MPHLFVAIDLPAAVRDQLRSLHAPLAGVRWANPDQAHLTLRFIGATDAGVEARIRDALAAITAHGGDLLLSGLDCFPRRGTPRVLWVGAHPDPWLVHLQTAVEAAVTACGVAAGAKRFTPHVTLARLQRPAVAQVHRYLDALGSFEAPPFTVREFALYASVLHRRGAVHTRVAEYGLLEPGG